jgi:hypothetical protein
LQIISQKYVSYEIGKQRAIAARKKVRASKSGRGRISLAFAAIKNLEIVTGIRREKPCNMAQALGQGWSGKQWVFALAKIMVVEVNSKRQHVHGQRVRKS